MVEKGLLQEVSRYHSRKNFFSKGWTIYKFWIPKENRNDEERSKRIKEINFLTTLNYNLQKKHDFNINLFKNDINSIIDQANKDDTTHHLLLDGIDHIERENTEQNFVF